MGLRVRKSIKIGKHLKLNVGKNGVSTSIKVGNVTHNSKRGTTVNLGHGVSYHVPNNKSTKANARTNTSTPVRSQQQRKKIIPSENECKIINFIVKIILYPIAVFFTLGFIFGLGNANIAYLFGTFVIGIGSGIAAKKFDIRKKFNK